MYGALDGNRLCLMALGNKHTFGLDGISHDYEQGYGKQPRRVHGCVYAVRSCTTNVLIVQLALNGIQNFIRAIVEESRLRKQGMISFQSPIFDVRLSEVFVLMALFG